MSPINRVLENDNSYKYESLDSAKSELISEKIRKSIAKQVYSIVDSADINNLCNDIIRYFAE